MNLVPLQEPLHGVRDWRLVQRLMEALSKHDPNKLYSIHYLEFVASIRGIAKGLESVGEECHVGLGYGLNVVCLP